MNIPVEFFESHIPEEAQVKGEKLYDATAVKSFQQESKRKYSYNISDPKGSDFTVILSITNGKLKTADCTCLSGSSQNICKHIACSLFHYRANVHEENMDIAIAQTTKRQKPVRTDSIVNQLSLEELQSFIKSYAKKDKEFSLALKIQYISKIEDSFGTISYKQILDQLIRPRSTKNFSYSAKETASFKKFFEVMYGHIQDNLALKRYSTAFELQQVCLEKLYYLQYWLKKDDAKITAFIRNGVKNIQILLQSDISPEFRIDIFKFLVDLFRRSYFRTFNTPSQTLDILLDLSQDLGFDKTLSKVLLDKFQHEETDPHTKLNCGTYLLKIRTDKTKILKLIQNESFDFNIKIIRILMNKEYYDIAEQLLKTAEKNRSTSSNLLQDLWLALYELQGNHLELCKLAVQCFVHSGKDRYYLKAKEFSGQNWTEIQKQVEKNLVNLYQMDQYPVIFHFYDLENLTERSKKLIIENHDFDALSDQLPKLLNLKKDSFIDMARQILSYEIENHAGKPLNEKITHLFQLLVRHKAYSIKKSLNTYIDQKYAYRKSLIKELARI